MKSLKSVCLFFVSTMLLGLSGCMAPLVQASGDGDITKVRSMLDSGADPNWAGVRGAGGGVPIIWASMKGHADVVKLLLEKGADPNKMDHVFFALREAVVHNHPDVVKVLLDDPATEVDETNHSQITSLAFASCANREEMVKLLIAHKANPTITHWPIFCNHEKAKKLIETFTARNSDQ